MLIPRKCFAIVLALGAGCIRGDETVGRDSGFDADVRGWFPYRQVANERIYAIVTGEGAAGSNTACIQSQSAVPAAAWFMRGFLSAEAGALRTLDLKVKAEIAQGYAYARIVYWTHLDGVRQVDGSRQAGSTSTARISGSSDGEWESVRHVFAVPQGVEGLHVQLWVGGDFVGRVLFDDVAVSEGVPPPAVPRINALPELDGIPDADFTNQATQCGPFLVFPGISSQLAEEPTTFWIAVAPEHLVVAGECRIDPARSLRADLRGRDDDLWRDDSVEFFITRMNQEAPYYHFVVNPNGALHDAVERNGNWNSRAQAVAATREDGWTFELAIPLEDLGFNPVLDTHVKQLGWRMNAARNHWGGERAVHSTWGRVVSSFHDPENFVAVASPGGAARADVGLRHWTRDGQARPRGRPRHWKVEDPLYEALILDEPKNLHGEGAMIWPRPIEMEGNRQFALQYGQVYAIDDIHADYARHNLRAFTRIGRWEPSLAQNLPSMRRHQLGLVLYFPYNHRMAFDDAMVAERLALAEAFMDEHRDVLWGVCMGDEVMYHSLRRFIALANDPGQLAADPLLAKAVRTIRDDYGYGRYGVPASPEADDQPLDWLATRRWYVDRQIAWMKKVHASVKTRKTRDGRAPVILSADPINNMYFQQLSRQAPWFDIATGQSLPANNPFRQRTGYDTKLLKDLSGKEEVWPCAHTEPYPGVYSVEETTAFLSEIARCGGTGLHIWNYDYIGEQAGVNGTRFDYYGHRPRWDARLDVVDRFRNMGKLKFPDPDFAVFVSNDHAQTHPRMSVSGYEALFNMAGPGLRSWFSFISDIQVQDGIQALDRWKVVFLPEATIQRREVSARFPDYVEQGGTLVCFDPQLFARHADGSDTSSIRETLFGAKTRGQGTGTGLKLAASPLWPSFEERGPLPFSGNCWKLVADPGTTVLATFENGDPAIVLKEHASGGRAILFAFKMDQGFVAQPVWRDFFLAFFKGLGIRTGQDIWRFRFPYASVPPPSHVPDDPVCLTGNHLQWWMNQVVTAGNLSMPNGSYRHSLQPDAPGEQHGGEGDVSFSRGDLTDRLDAPRAGDVFSRKNADRIASGDLSLDQFVVGWSMPDAFSITFDLGAEHDVEKVRAIYTGSLPGLSVFCSRDNDAFALLGEVSGTTTQDVLESVVAGTPIRARHVRIDVAERPDGPKLTLSEIEVWGTPVGDELKSNPAGLQDASNREH